MHQTHSDIHIDFISSSNALDAAYPVMHQLRPQLTLESFKKSIKLQLTENYQLIALTKGKTIRALAGFRINHCLAWGKYLYIDDLVTKKSDRKSGYAQLLIDFLQNYAKQQQCDQLHLDSGHQRFAAHKFYLKNDFLIVSHHFAKPLSP